MTESQGIWFVYRSPHVGPLGKRVRRVAAPSVLGWFQAMIEEARVSAAPERIADAALGGPVHGLGALFEAAKKHSLHTPKTTGTLTKLLHEHLHVEGGTDSVRLDAHALRVFTNDADTELAWFFFDDEALRKSPRTLAYLLHDETKLPDGDADRPFATAPVPACTSPGEGEGATWACLNTFYDRHALHGRAMMFPGVRLPALAARLRAVTPDLDSNADGPDRFPIELRLLRAMLDDGDEKLAPALARVAAYPLGSVVKKGDHAALGGGAIDAARASFEAAAAGVKHAGDPTKSIVSEGEHAALLAAHTDDKLGYQQWILFDDRWAAANPDLATSMLHYAEHADPFAPLRAARPPAPAAKAKADKPKAKGPSKSAVAKDEKAWKAAIGERETDGAPTYRPTSRLDAGALISHTKFGLGVVTRTETTKVEVLFRDGPRLLVHGATL